MELTRPVSSTKIARTVLMTDIKVSKVDTDLKPVKNIIKNPQNFPGTIHVQKEAPPSHKLQEHLSKLKEDIPSQKNC